MHSCLNDKEKENSKTIDFLVTDSIQLQQKIKLLIDMNSTFVKESEWNPSILEQEKRIVKNLQGSLVKNFQNILTDFGTVESDIKSIHQSKTIRSAEIFLGRTLDSAEKQNIVNDPQVSLVSCLKLILNLI
jgi:hypothetical protein